MRTTVTLDPDTVLLVERRMRERGVSFKQALNDCIRQASDGTRQTPFTVDTVAMGQPVVNLDRALQLAGELEDEELLRRQVRGA